MNALAIAVGIVSVAITAEAAPILFSSSGPAAASIQGTVDSFRTALGTLNPNVAGSFGSGRREINWDGVPDALAAPNNLPPNFFNVNSPRGAVFSTPGTGFQVSANAGVAPLQFANIDVSYPSLFEPFSLQRLFTAIGSNTVDVSFFVPGSTTPAFVSGFGSVFSDVDVANTTSITFFTPGGVSLGTFFAPAVATPGANINESFSFLGVMFNAGEQVGSVRITNGNAALGPGITELLPSRDLVVMDDFIYAEPQVPEPGVFVLLGSALLSIAVFRRRRWRKANLHQ